MTWYEPWTWDDGPQVGDNIGGMGYQPAPSPTRGFGGGNFGSPAMANPLALGQSIGRVAAGKEIPGASAMFDQQDQQPGAFSQLGSAIAGGLGKVGHGLGSAAGAVGGFIGWDQMKPMEKAQLLAAGIGGAADIYGAYKQGKVEDEERKKRQRSAEALRPYITSLMDKFGS